MSVRQSARLAAKQISQTQQQTQQQSTLAAFVTPKKTSSSRSKSAKETSKPIVASAVAETAADTAVVSKFATPTASTAVDTATVDAEQPEVDAERQLQLEKALAHLKATSPRFARLIDSTPGAPSFSRRRQTEYQPTAFEELLTTIVYQQLHGKAAASIYRRVLGLFGIEPRADSSVDGLCPTPEMVLTKSKTELRSAGLSEKKAEYMLGLASAFNDGTINPDEFGELTDEELMNKLVALKGIGAWTVHMFMMFYLRRPDVLPVGDLGVQRGMCELFKQPNTEEEDEEEESDEEGKEEEEEEETKEGSQEKEDSAVNIEVGSQDIGEGSQDSQDSQGKKRRSIGSGSAKPKKKTKAKTTKKGPRMTPKEMTLLAEPWRPYRSYAAWYMWRLTDTLTQEAK